MPAIEDKDLLCEGNSPAQVSPFQEQLKSSNRGLDKGMTDPLPKAQQSDYPLADFSGSPETSERPHPEFENLVNKCVGNSTEQPRTISGSNLGSTEHGHRANKGPNGHHGKSKNPKSRTRFESDVDSTSDTNCEFRQEVSKLTSLLDDTSKNDMENRTKTSSKVPLPKSVYDNNPLSATSNPLHIDILKEKIDSTVTESMPRILPPQDVQIGDLETTYRKMLQPFSRKYSKELQQPLLEDSSRSFVEGKFSKRDESNSTVQSIDERSHRSFRDCFCC